MESAIDLYKDWKKGPVELAYRGVVRPGLFDSIFHDMEATRSRSPEVYRQQKKVNNILIESLQNIHHHSKGQGDELASSEVIFLVRKDDGGYRIVTGNRMLRADVPELISRIEKINSLSEEELRTYYQESLRTAQLSEKGGAGLGMIHMARQSGNKLDFRFDNLDDRLTYFSLMLFVK